MQNVMFTANPLDTSAWELHQVSDIYTFLQEKLPEWPPSARIYREHVAESHDVTPTCEADVNALGDMDNLYVVVYPADPASIIISVVLSAAITAAAFLLRRDPEFPVDEQRVASSNNSLSGRSNKSRLNGRIPDIFGKIRSLPDLIAVPYRTYEDNQEVETAYLCVGRGQYEIPVDTVREGDTPINQIVGSSAVIYGPNASPNGGSVQATIGAAIADAVLSVVEANQVNGQVLNPPNDAAVIGTNNIRFTFPNIIELLAGANLDFTEKFANNDVLAITNAAFTGSIDNGVFTESMRFVSPNIIEFQTFDPSSNFQANDVIALFNTGSYTGPRKDLVIEIDDNMTFALDGTITVIGGGGFSGYLAGDNVVLLNAQYDDGSTAVDLDGTYEIATAPGGTTITLVSPATVNSDWNLIDNYAGDVTGTVNGVETTVNRPQGNLTTQLQGNYTISSVTPTTIVLSNPENVAAGWTNLTEYPNDRTEFETHDVALSGGNKSVNLNGSYTALSVSSNQITLDNPAGTNADWNELADYIADSTDYISPTISSSGDRWIGPFNVEVDTLEQIFTNFVARRGLYSIDDGGQQRSLAVEVELEVDSLTNGVPDGNPELFQVTINGSATLRTLRAATIRANPTFSGPMQIRARRITERDLEFDGTITDEIEWERAYGISPVSQSDFGDITTIHTRTRATSGALAVRRRELNAVVTRRVGLRISGDTFDTVLTATQDAAEILAAVLRDPVIGNRPVSQIDVDNIYDTIAEVETHFGTALARQFNYSFDETDFSLEQTIASIATACFCTAYRQGNIIKVSFEKATVDSTLLFNHRNKLPGSENRVVSFGRQNNHDGVELTYIDPNDGSTLYYLIPNDNTATNPRRVQTVGIGSQEQAYYHAWRAWNKIRYQNTTTQFTATQEAAATILLDRILVADNTRSDVQDGQVVRINGLLITTSQPVTFEGGETYTVFLQNTDGTVDVRVATEVIGQSNQFNIDTAPTNPLNVNQNYYAQATYLLVKDSASRKDAFLVTEKSADDGYNYQLSCINYDDQYYLNDNINLWLPFEEASFRDQSPTPKTGTVNGAGSVITEVGGRNKHVYQGTAVIDSYAIDTAYNFPASYSITCWLNKTDFTTRGSILNSPDGSTQIFRIEATTGDLEAGHASVVAVSSAWPASGAWHHAAVTYDSATNAIKLYINGAEVASSTITGATLGDMSAFAGYIGLADDLRLFNRALTAAEIKAIYDATVI